MANTTNTTNTTDITNILDTLILAKTQFISMGTTFSDEVAGHFFEPIPMGGKRIEPKAPTEPVDLNSPDIARITFTNLNQYRYDSLKILINSYGPHQFKVYFHLPRSRYFANNRALKPEVQTRINQQKQELRAKYKSILDELVEVGFIIVTDTYSGEYLIEIKCDDKKDYDEDIPVTGNNDGVINLELDIRHPMYHLLAIKGFNLYAN